MNGILLKLKQGMNTFSSTERKIAEYILNDTDELMNISITILARKCNVSEGSVVRFCKNLGLKGYQELKIKVSEEYGSSKSMKQVIYEPINNDDSAENIIDKVFSENITAVLDTQKILDSKELEKAIELIRKCKRLAIFGAGESMVVAMDMQYKFARINIETAVFVDSHMQLIVATNLGKDDVAIGISHSGRTIDVIKCLDTAKKNGAGTICITQFGNSPITDVSEVKLFTACTETNLRAGAMASRIAQLSIVDSLFIGVACTNYDEVVDYLKRTREIVDDKKL